MFNIYNPDVIAVHTTCLSETIGDDIPQIIQKAIGGKSPQGQVCHSCEYAKLCGSHVTGFASMVKGMVDYFSENTGSKTNQINIIPGWVEPSDMKEIKRIADLMKIKTVMFPDTSGVLDTPLTGTRHFYPKGGVKISELKSTGSSSGTIALGHLCSAPAAKVLDSKCKVPCEVMNVPIGLLATDNFVYSLRKLAGVSVPDSLDDERGKLLDIMSDMHQYLYGKRVALFGDPDILVP